MSLDFGDDWLQSMRSSVILLPSSIAPEDSVMLSTLPIQMQGRYREEDPTLAIRSADNAIPSEPSGI